MNWLIKTIALITVLMLVSISPSQGAYPQVAFFAYEEIMGHWKYCYYSYIGTADYVQAIPAHKMCPMTIEFIET